MPSWPCKLLTGPESTYHLNDRKQHGPKSMRPFPANTHMSYVHLARKALLDDCKSAMVSLRTLIRKQRLNWKSSINEVFSIAMFDYRRVNLNNVISGSSYFKLP